MNISELDQLMHAVLDGEATPAEASELDRQLAADPAARERFDDLKWLFDGFRRVPKAFPPEGLVAASWPRYRAGRSAAAAAPTFVAVACN
jgi:anti-sigma factor RsiW